VAIKDDKPDHPIGIVIVACSSTKHKSKQYGFVFFSRPYLRWNFDGLCECWNNGIGTYYWEKLLSL